MMKKYFAVALFVGSLQSCNVFRDFPDKSSDSYYLDQAELYLDQYKFDKAISRITPLLISQPKNPRVIRIASMAYAGRAGLRTLDLILGLTDLGNKTFFMVLAEHYPGATASHVNDVRKSIEIIENFQPNPTLRTSEMNLVALFLYFSQIGVNLNNHAYTSSNSMDTSFDACDDVTDFPDAANTDVLQGLAKAVEVAPYLGTDALVGVVNDLIDNISNLPIAGVASVLTATDVVCPGADPDEESTCAIMRYIVGDGNTNNIGLDTGQAGGPCP